MSVDHEGVEPPAAHAPDGHPGYYDLLASRLFTAVVSDILDSEGLPSQVPRLELRAVGGSETLVGRARIARAIAVDEAPAQPYERLLAAIDSLGHGDVLVIDAGGRVTSGLFGGLLATAVMAAGGRGVIVHGGTRDSRELRRLGFPVFTLGLCPADSLGRDEVVEVDVPAELGGVVVSPGDLIVADEDGMVVVPSAVERTVIEKALEKVSGENRMREELAAGMKASEAFRRYGIL